MNTHSTAPLPISVSGEADLPDLGDVTAVISIRDPHDDVPPAVLAAGVPTLTLAFQDTEDDGPGAPQAWHLLEVERFARRLPAGARLHVHCFAGVSRSTAVASFVLALLAPRMTDLQIARHVLQLRPQAVPNDLLLRHADALLARRLRPAWRRLARY
ncbi:hypothetical protein [Deinococcus aquiradiocola]|uniref:Tyrosine specific protein phosphatases domain-containing protein n=1 Tax=Deinococcus aquiradiocola TaxID=393059 RepID=A0A917P9M4_9DEIO|nr:hypothetical protein [Deinococcus aquiradiocola]GGJ67726.1 hypothetical protein GCM10008939_10040 [Deinococcus aquiradiocola]